MNFGLSRQPFVNRIPPVIREEVDALAAEFKGLQAADAPRLKTYQLYRSELERVREQRRQGDLWSLDHRADRHVPQRENIELPLGRALTVKHTHRVAGRLPSVIIPKRDASVLEEYRSATIEKVTWGIIYESQGAQQFSAGGWDASELGSACFDIYWEPLKQMPIFREVDPGTVITVRGLHDPHEFQRVYRFWNVPLRVLQAQYGAVDFRGETYVDLATSHSTEHGMEMCTIVAVSDDVRTLHFTLGGNVPLMEELHGYGFCPYVVIPNLGPERAVWGWSDYEMVRELTNYLPRLFSREADVIKAAAGGGYTEHGTGQPVEAVAKVVRDGGVLPARRDSELRPIPAPDIPDFLPSHVDQALKYFEMLSFSPPAAWGAAGSTSGSDRGLQMQPQFELTALKQLNWASGLQRLFSRCFRMICTKQITAATYRGEVQTMGGHRRSPFTLILEPDAFDDPDIDAFSQDEEIVAMLPRDPIALFNGDFGVDFVWQNRIDPDDPVFVNTEIQKYVGGIQSLKTTLERLGATSPEDEMKRIEEEAERFPWQRDGVIKLLLAQLGQEGGGQGAGGGAPQDPMAMAMEAGNMMQNSNGAAMDVDAGFAGMGAPGVPYGGA